LSGQTIDALFRLRDRVLVFLERHVVRDRWKLQAGHPTTIAAAPSICAVRKAAALAEEKRL
jgi:hypothetical protein